MITASGLTAMEHVKQLRRFEVRRARDGGRMKPLKSPFPWFGGKSKVAKIVWDRFGEVPNYVEPFFGSGAVLLNRPHKAGTESINDLDCMVANSVENAVGFHGNYSGILNTPAISPSTTAEAKTAPAKGHGPSGSLPNGGRATTMPG